MQLVITEKPSVAQSIAKVLGADERKDGYMEGNGSIVSWCVGHLVELAQPDAYSDAWKKWTYDSLPMIPEHWQHEVKKDTVAQFRVLKELMHDTRVEQRGMCHGCWIVRRGDKQIKIKKGLSQSFKGYDSNGYSLFYAVTTV